MFLVNLGWFLNASWILAWYYFKYFLNSVLLLQNWSQVALLITSVYLASLTWVQKWVKNVDLTFLWIYPYMTQFSTPPFPIVMIFSTKALIMLSQNPLYHLSLRRWCHLWMIPKIQTPDTLFEKCFEISVRLKIH
jgi:hypothetical protein